jgi:hypothetical protein
MFFINILKMSHRHLIPFARRKPTSDVTKAFIKIEREKINNKLMIQLREHELINYRLQMKNKDRYMK